MRLDKYLSEKMGIRSRTLAAELIRLGAIQLVQGGRRLVAKASTAVDDNVEIKILDHPLLGTVSRGVLKLAPAMSRLGWNLDGKTVLDIGQSTGGFTQACLNLGAQEVIGIDIGQGQLSADLCADARVRTFEKINAKDITAEGLHGLCGYSRVDVTVMDVSFISIKKIIPQLSLLAGRVLTLVKPQFELGAEHLNKSGVVRDESLFVELELQLRSFCQEHCFEVKEYFESELRGKNGNKEFFMELEPTD